MTQTQKGEELLQSVLIRLKPPSVTPLLLTLSGQVQQVCLHVLHFML